MKKLIAALSAFSLFASSGTFAQETGTDAPAAEETPATTEEERGMKDCAPLTDALKKKLCELHNERMKIKAAAKAVHESKVAKTARKVEKKAARAAMKGRKKEMKQEVRMMKDKLKDAMREGRAEIKETRENFRGEMKGVRRQKVRRERKGADQESQTEESGGQALLQPYGRVTDSSEMTTPRDNQKMIRASRRPKGSPRKERSMRSSRLLKQRRDEDDQGTRARRENRKLPKQPEAMGVEGAQ